MLKTNKPNYLNFSDNLDDDLQKANTALKNFDLKKIKRLTDLAQLDQITRETKISAIAKDYLTQSNCRDLNEEIAKYGIFQCGPDLAIAKSKEEAIKFFPDFGASRDYEYDKKDIEKHIKALRTGLSIRSALFQAVSNKIAYNISTRPTGFRTLEDLKKASEKDPAKFGERYLKAAKDSQNMDKARKTINKLDKEIKDLESKINNLKNIRQNSSKEVSQLQEKRSLKQKLLNSIKHWQEDLDRQLNYHDVQGFSTMSSLMARVARVNNFACTGRWFCPECGKEMKSSKYCDYCGANC